MKKNALGGLTSNHTVTRYEVPATGATTAAPFQFLSSELKKTSGSEIKAVEAARYLVHLAAAEEEPEFLTHLRLQKLLYFAQGWSLVMRSKPLFSERIEAWSHGPVVPIVYREFKAFGDRPIEPQSVPVPDGLTDDDREFLAALWGGYKKYSASSLRQMTHEHQPWIDARKGLRPEEACTVEITRAAMKAYFKKLLKA